VSYWHDSAVQNDPGSLSSRIGTNVFDNAVDIRKSSYLSSFIASIEYPDVDKNCAALPNTEFLFQEARWRGGSKMTQRFYYRRVSGSG